ncbi:metal-dependent transcriptional regulator [Hufsiella ginkgonis]|uniref:Transcriptional regulator MntR n=1 Tax=Hufsiella ginkgonis TaxID=2695274 RepID=A0A7K1XY61_9SPHI|nr:metal-dependent transcriptional regulator [Hufsiella ginkgonis]
MNSLTEENYLKAIYHLSKEGNALVTTNNIADSVSTKASSVTDMLKKLADKNLIHYVKYQGVSLTGEGLQAALGIIRKHRLWEVFLVEKLNFKWDEVHDIAEELEHIRSEELVDRLQEFLGNPKSDPHGDLIPDKHGKFHKKELIRLSKMKVGDSGSISGVNEHSAGFLRYLEKTGLVLGKKVVIYEIIEFDSSVTLLVDNQEITVSRDVAKNILVYEQ